VLLLTKEVDTCPFKYMCVYVCMCVRAVSICNCITRVITCSAIETKRMFMLMCQAVPHNQRRPHCEGKPYVVVAGI